jgi:glycosyltransferase involved in cell wall biosynthesis
VQFFFDGQRTDQHQVWKAVKKLDLLANVSFTARRVGHRELLMMADALIHPQAPGRSRAITLMAMAHAVPVLAAEDEFLDYLIDGHTAWLLPEPDTEAWVELIDRLIAEPGDAADLGRRARAWVGEERLASEQIARTLALYRTVSGEPLPFVGMD